VTTGWRWMLDIPGQVGSRRLSCWTTCARVVGANRPRVRFHVVQWHTSCVTGSLCAFATRMETGLFKQQTCVIRELTGSIFAKKTGYTAQRPFPASTALRPVFKVCRPVRLLSHRAPLVQTRIWTRLHTFCFNLCLVRSRTMSRKARSVVPSHKLVARNPIATAS